MRWFLLLILVLVPLSTSGCTGDAGKEKVYDVKGKVVSVDADKKKIKLDHEAIPGLMGAMEMPFDVADAKLLEGLKAGDQVQGKFKAKDGTYTLTELKKQ